MSPPPVMPALLSRINVPLSTTDVRSSSWLAPAVMLNVGDSPALSITAGANQLDDLTSVVDNGTLILDSNAGMTGGGDISYALVVPAISQLELRGSGDATGTGVVDGDFSLIVSGSGAANLTGLD